VRRVATRSTSRGPEQVKRSGSRENKKATPRDGPRGQPGGPEAERAIFRNLLASSSVEGTLGAAAHAFLSRGCVQRGPIGTLCVTRGVPGRSVLSSPSYRKGAVRCDSRQRLARISDTGCPGRTGWGKSTKASGRRGGGRKRDRKARGPWPGKARLVTPSREPSSDQRWHASA